MLPHILTRTVRHRCLLLIAAAGALTLLGSPTTPAGDTPKAAADLPFRVPPGFVAERIAGPPLVEFPMFASFDDDGRLYVVDSAGVNREPDQLRKNPPHRIRLLEDTKHAGRFDRSRVFVDHLTYPQGVLWHDGAVYCASPPSLWRFRDTRHTGTADQREEMLTGFTFTRWADDLHGPALGPDGRIYWTCGRYPYRIHRPGGKVLHQGDGPRVLRCRPDGREVEIYCSAIGNPVEVAFSAEGEAFTEGTYSLSGHDGMAFAPGPGKYVPQGNERDAFVHCVVGGVYPIKDRNATESAGVKHPGDLLPVMVHMDAVAPSGLMRYRGDALGAEYRDNFFGALFGARCIKRYILERDGATFRARTEDFVTAASEHFHPTDVLEDADGSLIIVDTGNWYSLCPGSHVGATLVRGGIYRVRRKDAPALPDPRGLALKWNAMKPGDLTNLLNDPRFMVRDRAIAALAKQGADAVQALRSLRRVREPRWRRNAVWALCRIDGDEARSATRLALYDGDASVRQTAVYAAGLHRDAEALPRLLELLRTDTLPIRREAATSLGRIGKAGAVSGLLDALRTCTDRFLEHALVHALIEINDPQGTLAGLGAGSPEVRRGALIALDQMDAGRLTREQVVPLANTIDPALQQTVLHVLARHPDWAGDVTGLVRDWLRQEKLPPRRQESLRGMLLAFSKQPAVQRVVAEALHDPGTPAATRLLLLETVARAPLDRLPAAWVEELGWCLSDPQERIVLQAVEAVQAGGVTRLDAALLCLAQDRGRGDEVRVAALKTVAPRLPALRPGLFQYLLGCLTEDRPPLVRLGAATALAHAPLTEEQLRHLAAAVGRAGPLELARLLPAYERCKSAAVGRQLIEALARSPGLPGLTADSLRKTLKPYPSEVRESAHPLVKRLDVDADKQAARLAELTPLLHGGDAARGRALFFSKKMVCTTCHTVQGQGGRVGPDLSHIAATRTGRELLEAVVFPSASFARGYEPYVVATLDGRTFTGIIAREAADAIYLVDAERAETRLPRRAIESILPGKVSIMPQGLDTQMTRQELADLLAFLQGLK